MAELRRCLKIFCEEKRLDARHRGRKFARNRVEIGFELDQSCGQCCVDVEMDNAVSDMFDARAFARRDAPAAVARAGVDAENFQRRCSGELGKLFVRQVEVCEHVLNIIVVVERFGEVDALLRVLAGDLLLVLGQVNER